MKKTWRGRVLAMLLVLALTVGLVPAALAADSSTPVTFKRYAWHACPPGSGGGRGFPADTFRAHDLG